MKDIVSTPDTLGGKPRVKGTRVSAEQIYEMHVLREMAPEEIADKLPTVELEGVKAAIEYGRQNPEKQADILSVFN